MLDGVRQKVCGKSILITSSLPQVSVFKWQDRKLSLMTAQQTQWLRLSEWRVACTLKVPFSKNLLKTTGMSFLNQHKRNLSHSKKLATVTLCFSKVCLSYFGTFCHVFNLGNWNSTYVYFCQLSCFPEKKEKSPIIVSEILVKIGWRERK